MAKFTISLNYDEFTAPIVNSNRSALAKAGVTGGFLVKLSELPANVVQDLLHEAITKHLQAGLPKAAEAESATTESCQAAMKARWDMLVQGSTAGTKARKTPTRDPIKAEATRMLKKAITDRSDEKLDGKTLTTMVSQLFKVEAAYKKGGDQDEKLAPTATLVRNAMASAKKAYDDQQSMNESLNKLAERAAKASKEAKAQREAEAAAKAAEEAGEEAEAPKPTPTEKRKAEVSASKKKPAAR